MTLEQVFRNNKQIEEMKNKLSVRAEPSGDCIIYTGMLAKEGYGVVKVNRKTYFAHRMIVLLRDGEIPDGLVVMHTCDVRSCIKLEHLRVGTVFDNNQDALEKRRLAWQVNREDFIGRVQKFSTSTVLAAIRHCLDGMDMNVVCEKFGMSKGTLNQYLKDLYGTDIWKDIPKVAKVVDTAISGSVYVPSAEIQEECYKLFEEGMYYVDIAAKLKISGSTCRSYLIDKYGSTGPRKRKITEAVVEKILNGIGSGESVDAVAKSVGVSAGSVYLILRRNAAAV